MLPSPPSSSPSTTTTSTTTMELTMGSTNAWKATNAVRSASRSSTDTATRPPAATPSRGQSPSVTPPSVAAPNCGVDLRSAKVCELGQFNYKAKHVFYPLERSKFRCRYDYYWASIFKADLATDKLNIVLFNVNFSNGLPQDVFREVRSTNFFPKKWAIHALDVGFGFNCLLVYM